MQLRFFQLRRSPQLEPARNKVICRSPAVADRPFQMVIKLNTKQASTSLFVLAVPHVLAGAALGLFAVVRLVELDRLYNEVENDREHNEIALCEGSG